MCTIRFNAFIWFSIQIASKENISGITNELSKGLHRKEQDNVNALTLFKISNERMQMIRDNEWDSLLDEVPSFYAKYEVIAPNMNDKFVARGQPRRRAEEITNLHHYCVRLFYTIIDMKLQDLNNHFTEANTELLLCVVCLNPNDSFSTSTSKN